MLAAGGDDDDPGARIPATRHPLTARSVMGGGFLGWEEGLVAVKCIFMVLGRFFLPKKSNRQMRCWGGVRHSSRHQWHGTKPSAGIIAHGVGVTPMRLLVASSDHRRWYGPKPPAAMVGGNRDVSGETEVVMRGSKVS